MESKGTTIRQRLGWDGAVKAAFVGGDWSISPKAYLPREQWESAKRSLRAIIPDDCVIRQGEDSVRISYDAKGIPSLLAADGSVWLRLGSSPTVEGFFRDFDGAVVD